MIKLCKQDPNLNWHIYLLVLELSTLKNLKAIKNTFVTIAIILAGLSVPACDSSNQKKDTSNLETTSNIDSTIFIVKMVQTNLLEAKMGTLAKTKSGNPALKLYADQLIVEHNRINTELWFITNQNKQVLSQSLNSSGLKQLNNLAGKTGKEFDAAYIQLVIDHLRSNLKHFMEDASSSTDLHNWASAQVPVWEDLLHEALSLQNRLQ